LFDFDTLGLKPALNDALGSAGFTQPTPIQTQAIPLALDGHDILGLAQTGTGKTLAFGLPLIDALLDQPGKPMHPGRQRRSCSRRPANWSTRSAKASGR
jgi:ATP-dependent RNA helicase RhlE